MAAAKLSEGTLQGAGHRVPVQKHWHQCQAKEKMPLPMLPMQWGETKRRAGEGWNAQFVLHHALCDVVAGSVLLPQGAGRHTLASSSGTPSTARSPAASAWSLPMPPPLHQQNVHDDPTDTSTIAARERVFI
eukprot:6175251-Pleurochrysis_carterae.AAC.2